jgi:hypothetical protein
MTVMAWRVISYYHNSTMRTKIIIVFIFTINKCKGPGYQLLTDYNQIILLLIITTQ